MSRALYQLSYWRLLKWAAGIEPAPASTSLTYTFSPAPWVTAQKRVSTAETVRSTGELHPLIKSRAQELIGRCPAETGLHCRFEVHMALPSGTLACDLAFFVDMCNVLSAPSDINKLCDW